MAKMKILLLLLAASLFVSKSAFTILCYLCLLMSFFLFKKEFSKNKNYTKNLKILSLYVGIYFLAVISNIFSLGGTDTTLKTALVWIWPLMVFPTTWIYYDRNLLKQFLWLASFSLLIACLYSYWNAINQIKINGYLNLAANRATSFWDISRWAVFCAFSLIVMSSILLNFKRYLLKNWQIAYVAILLFMTAVSLIINGSRAAWLAALIGINIVVIYNLRKLKLISVFIAAIFVFIALVASQSAEVRLRLQSVFNISHVNGDLTSTDPSNLGRLNMWKVSLDYFKEHPLKPTGFENTKGPLVSYLENKGPEYQQKYTNIEYSYNDQHSSYLSSLVQLGLVFSFVLFSYLFYINFKSIYCGFKINDPVFYVCISLLSVQLIIYVFYSSLLSFEAFYLFPVVYFINLTLLDHKYV